MTGDVALRPVEPADVDFFFAHQRDPEALRRAALRSRERPAFEARWRAILADESIRARTITVDGAVAGHVVCWPSGDRMLVGYWVGREHWRRGIGTRALRAFLDEVETRPLHALVASSNRPSMRVLEKCGFERAGEPTVGDDGVEEFDYLLP